MLLRCKKMLQCRFYLNKSICFVMCHPESMIDVLLRMRNSVRTSTAYEYVEQLSREAANAIECKTTMSFLFLWISSHLSFG